MDPKSDYSPGSQILRHAETEGCGGGLPDEVLNEERAVHLLAMPLWDHFATLEQIPRPPGREANSGAVLGGAKSALAVSHFTSYALQCHLFGRTRVRSPRHGGWRETCNRARRRVYAEQSRANPHDEATGSRSPFRKMQSGECHVCSMQPCERANDIPYQEWYTRETKRQLRLPLARSPPGIVCGVCE